MKPCMICLYKKIETDSAQELWNDMHTLKKTCLSLIKIGRKQFLQHNLTETTTCDPWERGKCIQGLKNQICTTEYFEAYCQLYLPSKNMSSKYMHHCLLQTNPSFPLVKASLVATLDNYRQFNLKR